MRKLMFISAIFLITLTSCKTKTKNPNDIINSSDITITIKHTGCFGGGTRTITIREENGIRTLTLTSDSDNGLDIPKKIIPFDKKKETILADLITAGISLPNDGYCTGHSKYIIKTEKYKCFFEDKTCSLQDHYMALIRY